MTAAATEYAALEGLVAEFKRNFTESLDRVREAAAADAKAAELRAAALDAREQSLKELDQSLKEKEAEVSKMMACAKTVVPPGTPTPARAPAPVPRPHGSPSMAAPASPAKVLADGGEVAMMPNFSASGRSSFAQNGDEGASEMEKTPPPTVKTSQLKALFEKQQPQQQDGAKNGNPVGNGKRPVRRTAPPASGEEAPVVPPPKLSLQELLRQDEVGLQKV